MEVTITAKAQSPLQKGVRKLVKDKLKENAVKNLGTATKAKIKKVFKQVKKEWPAAKRKIKSK